MATFLLVRHAEAPWSRDEGRSLSPAGQRAAEDLAGWLGDREIEAVYSSPYRRAVETVMPLAARIGQRIRERDGLRERTLGDFGTRPFEQAVAATWADFDFSHPGGESNRSAQHRALGVVAELVERHPIRPAVLATHGNLLVLLLHAFDASAGLELWRSLSFPAVYRLQVFSAGRGEFERVEERS